MQLCAVVCRQELSDKPQAASHRNAVKIKMFRKHTPSPPVPPPPPTAPPSLRIPSTIALAFFSTFVA